MKRDKPLNLCKTLDFVDLISMIIFYLILILFSKKMFLLVSLFFVTRYILNQKSMELQLFVK